MESDLKAQFVLLMWRLQVLCFATVEAAYRKSGGTGGGNNIAQSAYCDVD